MPLTPDPGTETFGSNAFFIHGDSKSHPGNASNGCIVISNRAVRERIWSSGDHQLRVER
ncbi:hypothetical protein QFZ91_003390 [Paraburkholderia sp. JPY419]